MRTRTARDLAWMLFVLLTFPGFSRAQQGNPQGQAIDTVRRQQNLSPGDQDFIRRWVEWEVNNFGDFAEFRGRFQSQYSNANNTPQFQRELAVQSTQTAVQRFGGGPLAGDMPHSLAQVLLDMRRVETVPALLAGLGVNDARTRYLCARGLVAQQRAIGADQAIFTRTIDAVRKAGLAETDPVVVGRIYEALAFSAAAQLPTVVAAYTAVFDQRLDLRRKTVGVVDGAELHAYQFFRAAGVIDALSAAQKADLVRRLAVFHRLDAENYGASDLAFRDRDRLERMLVTVEEILAAVVGTGGGGNVRRALETGGHANRDAVLQEVRNWVGNATTQQSGALNAAPWNVPLGAP